MKNIFVILAHIVFSFPEYKKESRTDPLFYKPYVFITCLRISRQARLLRPGRLGDHPPQPLVFGRGPLHARHGLVLPPAAQGGGGGLRQDGEPRPGYGPGRGHMGTLQKAHIFLVWASV